MNSRVKIIAEIGVNHNGSIKMAKELIDVAAEADADFVKFQTFKADSLVTKKADKADYQKKLTVNNESHFEMIKRLELNKSAHKELISYCMQKNIQFLSTAFDIESAFKRLSEHGSFTHHMTVVRGALKEELGDHGEPITLTCFEDGRVLVHGTDDIGRAKSICTRFIGI